ncbi:hypothetical protein ENBRE01_0248 [Enteropsectra breve]|nr:hypothetical protein ENBRE01_0248 [Enteropsectra breve]
MQEKKTVSKLDLDYDIFISKTLMQCKRCGDIYYKKANIEHICMHNAHDAKKRRAGVPQEIQKKVPHKQKNSIEHPVLKVSKSFIHNEIVNIWRRHGMARHSVFPSITMKDYEVLQESAKKEENSSTFSFSPYDNFF